MKHLLCLAALGLALSSCAPGDVEIRCGITKCSTNQRCEPVQKVCVLDEPPELRLVSPAAGALLSGDSLVVSGIVTDDTSGFAVELSTDDGQSWKKLALQGN